jgi:hypothetical protein
MNVDNTLPLFAAPQPAPRPEPEKLPPHNRTFTSIEASLHIRHAAPSMRQRVLQYIRDRGRDGSTDEECQFALCLKTQTQTARRNELMRDGLVVNSGRTRPTTSGCKATVWVAAREGGERI